MTPDIAILFISIIVMVYLFLTEKIPFEVTALAGLLLFTFLNFLSPQEAVSGFSSPAVITLIATFFLGAALRLTGVADSAAGQIYRIAAESEVANIAAVMLLGALLSAFMSNVAAVALLLPAVAGIAARSGIHPSKLFIPLSFGVVLGGTLTMIGTPPNIIATDLMRERGYAPFSFFEFFPFGIVLLFIGIVFLAGPGRYLLPRKSAIASKDALTELASLYRIYERIFSVKVPDPSLLHGMSLGASRFRETLGVQVIAIIRRGVRKLAPAAGDVIKSGDTLVVRGKQSHLDALLKFQGLKVIGAKSDALKGLGKEKLQDEAEERSLRIKNEELLKESLRDLRFRDKYGVAVAGIEREGLFIYKDIGRETLKSDDIVHVVGPRDSIEKLSRETPDLEFLSPRESEKLAFSDYLFFVLLPSGAALEGVTIKESRFGEYSGLNILGIYRDRSLILAPSRDEQLLGQDVLLVVGKPSEVEMLAAIAELKLLSEESPPSLESEDIGVVEVVLSPRSKLIEKTLKEINFREKYGFQVLAIWRESEPIRSRVSSIPLKFGDALLLQGPRNRFNILAQDSDFVVLSDIARPVRRKDKAWLPLVSLLVMVALVVSGIQAVHIAALLAATMVVLGGAVKMEEVYREVEWRIVFLVAALIPLGIAFDNTGAAAFLAENIRETAGGYGNIGVLLFFALLSSLLSQTLDSTVAVILLGPLGIMLAHELNISVHACLMTIALASSIAFLTPFSHKAHLLVMGAGGYRVSDYFKVGLIISILSLAAILFLIPVIYN